MFLKSTAGHDVAGLVRQRAEGSDSRAVPESASPRACQGKGPGCSFRTGPQVPPGCPPGALQVPSGCPAGPGANPPNPSSASLKSSVTAWLCDWHPQPPVLCEIKQDSLSPARPRTQHRARLRKGQFCPLAGQGQVHIRGGGSKSKHTGWRPGFRTTHKSSGTSFLLTVNPL